MTVVCRQADAKVLEAASLTMMQDAVTACPGPVVWAMSRFVTQADIADENRATARKLRTALTGGPAPPASSDTSAFVSHPPTVSTPLWGPHTAGTKVAHVEVCSRHTGTGACEMGGGHDTHVGCRVSRSLGADSVVLVYRACVSRLCVSRNHGTCCVALVASRL